MNLTEKQIERIKHSLDRHRKLLEEQTRKTKGLEQEFTFWGGWSTGFESGFCSAMEIVLDMLDEEV